MLTYGDGISDVNITKLLEFHISHGKIGTMTIIRPPGRFGELELVLILKYYISKKTKDLKRLDKRRFFCIQ